MNLINFFFKIKNKNPSKLEIYTGDYESWDHAQKNSTGYNSPVILEKVKQSMIKVKNGEAVYERDSVLFKEVHYSYPLLVSLLYCAAQNKGKLNIVDFGGSLGSTYFQNIKFLKGLLFCRWSIVEQPHFVSCGIDNFQDDTLKFFLSINEALKINSSNVILFSSTIQYLEDPISILEQMQDLNFDYI